MSQDNSNVKSVFERGLVEAQTQSADILKEYYRYCEAERDKTVFKGKVLAYVTPVSAYLYMYVCVRACVQVFDF